MMINLAGLMQHNGLIKIKRNSMDEYNDDDGSLIVVLILIIVLISIGIFYF